MNRLTHRDEYGNAEIVGVDGTKLQLPTLSFDEFNSVTESLNRLADYEDTNLTPEQLKKMLNDLKMIKFNVYAITEFIKEMEAEQ